MATEQTNLRLDTAIKAQAIAAAEARGMPLARLVEAALVSYLASDSGVVAENQMVADLAARIERLERLSLATGGDGGSYRVAGGSGSSVVAPAASSAAPKQPSQNRPQGGSARSQVSAHPPDSSGLAVGAALLAAGAGITEAQAMGPNRDRLMVTAHGMKARPWLLALGWRVEGRSWFPPE